MPYGTNTIFFVPKGKVTSVRKVTYGITVAEIRPQKAETHHTRLTVGGNLIYLPGDVSVSSWNKDAIWDKHHLLRSQGESNIS